MHRRRWLVAGLVVLLGVAAVAFSRRGPARLLVDTGPVTRQSLFRSTVTASGEIVAVRYADIGSSVMGKIVSLPVAEGERVKAGQVLARIDAVQAQADASGAGEQVGALEAEVQGAAQQVRAATADLNAAEARARDAEQQLTRKRGLHDAGLRVREGEMVVIGIQNQPGTTLMTISDLEAINAELKVAEADVLRVAIGQPATVTLEAMSGKRFDGRVVEIGASALPVAGTGAAAREFKVVVRLDKPDPGLRPGLTCDAEVVTTARANVLTVPLQAVVLRAMSSSTTEQPGVFVVADGQAKFTPVTPGVIGGLDIEVSGLGEGANVVVGPYQALRDLQDGTLVKVAPKGR
jgi:HlyD family secretion protein